MTRHILMATGALCLTLGATAQPAPSSAFDGAWRVNMTCLPYSARDDDAKPYKHEYPATVKGGVFEGTYGVPGEPGVNHLHGSIADDGSARLKLEGIVRRPEYAVNNPEIGKPYSYRVDASFSGNAGTGRRVGKRACDFRFARM